MGEIAEIKKMSSEQDDAVYKKNSTKSWDVPTELANKFIAVDKRKI